MKLYWNLFILLCWALQSVEAQQADLELTYQFTVAGELEFGDTGYLVNPLSAATDSKGNIFISDHDGRQVHKYSPDGDYMRSFGGMGRGPGEFNRIAEIAIDGKDRLLVLDRFQFKVARFNTETGNIEEHRFEDMPQINMMTLVPLQENYFAGFYVESGTHVAYDAEMRAVRVYHFGDGEKRNTLYQIFNSQFDPEVNFERMLGSGIGHKLARFSDHELIAGHTVYTGRHFVIDTESGAERMFINDEVALPHYHLMDPDDRPSDPDQRFSGAISSSGSMGRFYYQVLHQSMLLGTLDGSFYHIYRMNEKEGYGYSDYLEVFSSEGKLIYHDKLPDTMETPENLHYRAYLHLSGDGRLIIRDSFELDDPAVTVYRLQLK